MQLEQYAGVFEIPANWWYQIRSKLSLHLSDGWADLINSKKGL